MDQTGPARPPMLGGGGGNGGRQRSWVSSPSRVSSLASSSSSVHSLATPPQERFEFCAVIGSGSFGSVYLARDRCPGAGLSPDGRRRGRRRGTSGGGAGGLLRSGSAEEEEDGEDGGDEGEEGREQGDGKVAIKVVNLEEQEDEMEEIQREIAVLAHSSQCPQLTRYFGSYVVGRTLWIVMEYLEGGSLGDLLSLAPQGRVGEPVVAHAMRGLCAALAYLHGERKIHRDVKAKNLLVSSAGRVKLADFGAAAQLTETKGKRNTFAGTPFWMAPEVITQSSYDAKADIWSAGITAIELAKGRPPYAATHPVRALFLIPKNPPPRLVDDEEVGDPGAATEEDGGRIVSGAGMRPLPESGKRGGGDGGASSSFSAAFKDFVARCLVKEPTDRPDASELLALPFLAAEANGEEEGRRGLVALVELRRAQLQRQQEEAAADAACEFQQFDLPFPAQAPPHEQQAPPPQQQLGPEDNGGGDAPPASPLPALRVTRRRMIAALDLEEGGVSHAAEEEGGGYDDNDDQASTPNRAHPPAHGAGWASPPPPTGHTPPAHRRRRPPPSLGGQPSPCPSPLGYVRQGSSGVSVSDGSDGGGSCPSPSFHPEGGGGGGSVVLTPSRHRRPGHHPRSGHVRHRTGGRSVGGAGGSGFLIGRQHSFGGSSVGGEDSDTPRRGSPHCFPITRCLSTGSNTSAITLPAGATTAGLTPDRDPFYGTGAGSPFFPVGDEEEEEWGEEEDEEEEGLPRWDFSLQGPKDLAALMASAGFHNIGAPTGAGGVGGDGDDGGGDK